MTFPDYVIMTWSQRNRQSVPVSGKTCIFMVFSCLSFSFGLIHSPFVCPCSCFWFPQITMKGWLISKRYCHHSLYLRKVIHYTAFHPTLPCTTLVSSSVPHWSCGGGGKGGFMPFRPVHTSIPAQPNPAPLSEHPTSQLVSVYSDLFFSELEDLISQHIFSHWHLKCWLSAWCMWPLLQWDWKVTEDRDYVPSHWAHRSQVTL